MDALGTRMAIGLETLHHTDLVLVVDDEMYSRRITELILGKVGAPRVAAVESVEEAEKILSRLDRGPRLVILDVRMPVRGGLDLLRDIRSGRIAGVAREVPVIVLSGVEDEAVVAAAVALDADAFVRKPLVAEGLRARLPLLLAEGRGVKDAESYAPAPPPPAGGTGPDTPPPGAVRIAPGDLQPLQIVMADVRSLAGSLIVARGTVASGRLIGLLRDLAEQGLRMTPIWVRTAMDGGGERPPAGYTDRVNPLVIG